MKESGIARRLASRADSTAHRSASTSFGDPLAGALDEVDGSDFFDFVGAPRGTLRLYPRETHVAEKLHAYTLPRDRLNSRVKDLPDIALLAQSGSFEYGVLRDAIKKTFTFRRSHGVPAALPDPPSEWEAPYARLAKENGLPWPTLQSVAAAARSFIDPVLAGNSSTTWEPAEWEWRSGE